MGKVSSLIGKTLNGLLKPLGLKLTKLRGQTHLSAVVIRRKYNDLIRQFHQCCSELVFPDLPFTEGRYELLTEMQGTGIDEAMYILASLHRSMNFEGDVCEFGVAQGATSALLANEILSSNKNLWLFDSFKGLPRPHEKDELIDDIFGLGSIEAYQGRMCCQVDSVKSKLSAISFPFSKLKIVPGFIEETIKKDYLPEKVCFAYVDFDFYEPTLIALNFLSEHLSAGGSIIIDDYGFFSSGAKTAVDEFMVTHLDGFEMILPHNWAGRFAILVKSL